MSVIIYHNPKCSKSRQSLELLEKHNVDPTVVLYKEVGLTRELVLKLKKALAVDSVLKFIRLKEDAFKDSGVDQSDEQALINLLIAHPEILERPIVIKGERAVIGRPPENVLELI